MKRNVTINNEFTIRDASKVQQEILARSQEGQPVNITLKNLASMDCSGIQVLVAATKSGQAGSITLNNLQPELNELLQKTGFEFIIKYQK
jgi:anti-anti-sigma factor